MAASFIEERDANAVVRKILAELLDTDKLAIADVLYADGAIVSTAAPLPVVDAAQATASTTLTNLSQARSAAIASDKAGVVLMGRVHGTIEAVAEAADEAAPFNLNPNGSLRVYNDGAMSADIDSVFPRPYSPGAAYGKFRKRYTAAANEIAIAAPGAGFRIVVTNVRVSCRGTTAGQITVWEDTNADGIVDAGEPGIVDDDYAPTAALPTGSKSGPIYFQLAENKRLYVLASAAISFTLMMEYFVESLPA